MKRFLSALPILLVAAQPFAEQAAASSGRSDTCRVPGRHATVQRAVDDRGCGTIVLGAGDYPESLLIRRTLRLRGEGLRETAIEGRIVVEGAGIRVRISDLSVAASCEDPVESRGGAEVTLIATELASGSASACQTLGLPPMMSRLGDAFLVVDSDDARDPRIGIDAMGRSYFVFTDTDSDLIQWTSFDRDEALLTAAAPLATTTSTQERSDLAVRSDGSFYSVWRSDETANRHVRGRYYDVVDGLDPVDALVNDLPDPTTHNGLESGGLAALAGGGFAVTWSSRQTHGTPDPGDNDDVQGQTVNADGVVSGSPQFPVNNLVNSGRQTRADAAPTQDGGFLTVWESYMSDGYQIRGRRFASDGTPMGDEFRIETDFTGGQHDPRVAANDEGELLVVWEHGSTPRTIRGRLFDSSVNPVGDDFLVSSRTDVTQQFPDVGGGAEHFVVAWARFEDDWDVEARVVTGRDLFDGPAFQANTYDPDDLRHDEAGVGASGDRAVITWQGTFDESSGIHSITARTVHLCGIFCDGFEAGNTLGWSSATP